MNSLVKKIKTIEVEMMIVAIALVALGFSLVFFPEISQEIVCKAIGVALCVWGFLRLVTYFKLASREVLSSFGLVQGVSLITFGFYFVIKPGSIAGILIIALSAFIVIDGILKLQYAVDFYHLESKQWWYQLIAAAVSIIIGIIAFADPFTSHRWNLVYVGISLMVEGGWDIYSLFTIGRLVKKKGKIGSEADAKREDVFND